MTTSLLTTTLLGRLSRYYLFISFHLLSLNLVASIFFFLLLINFSLLQLLDENSSGILSRMQVMEVYLSLYPSAILSLLSLSYFLLYYSLTTFIKMAKNWGIGDITEEDVDDLFRIAGVDPSVQPSITLDDFRELVQIE